MSLNPQDISPAPEETARIAHAAYPKGNVYMHMRDVLGTIYENPSFAHLFPHNGQPAEIPWRLALITVMQFAKGLSDRQAADAVRGRIDWKYALNLEMTNSGFDHTVLSEFRTRLVEGQAEHLLLETMLTLFKERGWLKARGKQRTDSTHVLAKIRVLNRVLCVGETLRHALNCLAIVAPDWLRTHSQPEWVERYDARMEDARTPLGEEARRAFAETIGDDGASVLNAIYEATAPNFLREMPAVETLRQVWVQNYTWIEEKISWRSSEDIPPASRYIGSPYDTEAHYSKNTVRRGSASCAASVQMKFLHYAGEVESKTTSRTRTDLEGKPEEDNSMFIKQRVAEGMYAAALQVLCAWVDGDCQT